MKKLLLMSVSILATLLSSCQNNHDAVLQNSSSNSGARLSSMNWVPVGDPEWLAEGYTERIDMTQVPYSVQNVYNSYFSRISWIEMRGNNYDDETMLDLIETAALDAKSQIQNLSDISSEQKSELLEGLQGTADYTRTAYNEVIWNQVTWENSSSSLRSELIPSGDDKSKFIFGAKGRKFWRAVLRVVVAVAVVAAVVTFGVGAFVAIGKIISKAGIANAISSGASVGWGVLKKGIILGNWKVSSLLYSSLGAGLKNAEKNWHKPWQGLPEFVFGVKIAPIYY